MKELSINQTQKIRAVLEFKPNQPEGEIEFYCYNTEKELEDKGFTEITINQEEHTVTIECEHSDRSCKNIFKHAIRENKI